MHGGVVRTCGKQGKLFDGLNNQNNNDKKQDNMFNLDKFISDSVTFRPVSMFATDIQANA